MVKMSARSSHQVEQPDPADGHALPWTMHGAPGAETVLNGRRYLYFAGTGYLGLQGHPLVIAAAQAALAEHGIHTGTSRSGFGTSPLVREVEQRASELLATEDAIYLVSGYAGNFAVMAALSSEVDLAFIDENAHDCLRESTRLLEHLTSPPLVFRHRDTDHLAELLRQNVHPGRRPLVLTDGVFATSGHIAPLKVYFSVLQRYDGAMLHVDDAHGLATIGENGRGSLELANVPAASINLDPHESSRDGPRVFLSSTLSKAVGGHGGLLAGSRRFLDRVRRSSGWYRGSAAPASPIAAATAKGLELVQGAPELRRNLARNVKHLRDALATLGLDVETSSSPIVGLILQSGEQTQRVHQQLLDQGIAIGLVRDYCGAPPDGMLRIAVFATHTPAMIDRLVDSLRRALLAA
jgi:8-amino-7-oxononanoate synthase